MRFLVPLLLLPLIEIAGFAWVGSQVGALNTVLLVLLSGVIGILLIQRQGLDGVRQAQAGLRTGEGMLRATFDKLCLTFAGVLLLLPGFASDLLALTLFVPAVRRALLARMTIFMSVDGLNMRSRPAPNRPGTTIIDADFQEVGQPADDQTIDLPPPDSQSRSPSKVD